MFFIFEEAKETILEKAIILKKFEKKISKETIKVLWFYFGFNVILT